jgi:hypothetical protein
MRGGQFLVGRGPVIVSITVLLVVRSMVTPSSSLMSWRQMKDIAILRDGEGHIENGRKMSQSLLRCP